MILEWLIMIQWWLINGDYMWLWHCFTHIIQYSWLLMILEWLIMIQWWLIHGDYMWLWHCFTHIFQYLWLLMILVLATWTIRPSSCCPSSHSPHGFLWRASRRHSQRVRQRQRDLKSSQCAPDASIARWLCLPRWINSGCSYRDNINL